MEIRKIEASVCTKFRAGRAILRTFSVHAGKTVGTSVIAGAAVPGIGHFVDAEIVAYDLCSRTLCLAFAVDAGVSRLARDVA